MSKQTASLLSQHAKLVEEIQKYDPLSTILWAIELLRKLPDDPSPTLEDMQEWGKNYPYPWFVMILVRWALQNRQHRKTRRPVSEAKMFSLCNRIAKMSWSEEILQNFRGLVDSGKMLRNFHQQFPYQNRREEVSTRFARQFHLFLEMDSDKRLADEFVHKTGVSLDLYLKTLVDFCRYVQRKEPDFSLDMLAKLMPGPHPEAIAKKFLDTLSRDLDGAERFVRNHTSSKATISYQIYEPTPFVSYPLLAWNGQFIPYFPALLVHSMHSRAHKILKESCEKFPHDRLGEIFQSYVGLGLLFCAQNVWDENCIKMRCDPDRKSCDFFVEEHGSAILVDAKCTELPTLAKVAQDDGSMLANIQGTLIKAMKQIVSTGAQLHSQNEISDCGEVFGLIVTYESYFLVWETLSPRVQEKILCELAKFDPTGFYKRVRFLFADIESFDYLVAGIGPQKTSLSEMLSYASAQNADSSTGSLYFKDHFWTRWNKKVYEPKYLRDTREKYFGSV